MGAFDKCLGNLKPLQTICKAIKLLHTYKCLCVLSAELSRIEKKSHLKLLNKDGNLVSWFSEFV